MKQVDEPRLETDLAYRYDYLSEFMGFTTDDVARIHALAPKLLPHVPALVEGTYSKLLSYAATARHFLPRQHGYDGALPAGLDDLNQQSAQIQFRKEHLQRYLANLLGNPYDARMVKYLDVVGKIHTPQAGNRAIDVPLVQMNALMGLLSDVLTQAIFRLELPREEEVAALRAVGKLLWLQNDLINRHYATIGNGDKNGRVPAAPQPSEARPATNAWARRGAS